MPFHVDARRHVAAGPEALADVGSGVMGGGSHDLFIGGGSGFVTRSCRFSRGRVDEVRAVVDEVRKVVDGGPQLRGRSSEGR
jgi:hypothetical protein